MKVFNSYRIQVFFLLASIIVCIYTIISISDSSESAGTVFNSDGLIIKENSDDEPFDGKIIDTLANKIISYDVKNGLKNGEFTIFFLDGKKEISGKIFNNKNEGKWYYYYPSGKLETEGYFKNDIVIPIQ
jgi:antitoxin component YwqK of YwqJK toxin-antitoxin module